MNFSELRLIEACKDGNLELVQRLLDRPSVQPIDQYSLRRALEAAGTARHTAVVQQLLAAGTKVDSGTLCHAIKQGDANIFQLLLAAAPAAAIHDTDPYLGAPLHTAAACGKTEAVSALIAAGAPVDGVNRSGKTACHCAASSGHAATVSAPVAAGASVSARSVEHPSTKLLLAGKQQQWRRCWQPGQQLIPLTKTDTPLCTWQQTAHPTLAVMRA